MSVAVSSRRMCWYGASVLRPAVGIYFVSMAVVSACIFGSADMAFFTSSMVRVGGVLVFTTALTNLSVSITCCGCDAAQCVMQREVITL